MILYHLVANSPDDDGRWFLADTLTDAAGQFSFALTEAQGTTFEVRVVLEGFRSETRVVFSPEEPLEIVLFTEAEGNVLLPPEGQAVGDQLVSGGASLDDPFTP